MSSIFYICFYQNPKPYGSSALFVIKPCDGLVRKAHSGFFLQENGRLVRRYDMRVRHISLSEYTVYQRGFKGIGDSAAAILRQHLKHPHSALGMGSDKACTIIAAKSAYHSGFYTLGYVSFVRWMVIVFANKREFG